MSQAEKRRFYKQGGKLKKTAEFRRQEAAAARSARQGALLEAAAMKLLAEQNKKSVRAMFEFCGGLCDLYPGRTPGEIAIWLATNGQTFDPEHVFVFAD